MILLNARLCVAQIRVCKKLIVPSSSIALSAFNDNDYCFCCFFLGKKKSIHGWYYILRKELDWTACLHKTRTNVLICENLASVIIIRFLVCFFKTCSPQKLHTISGTFLEMCNSTGPLSTAVLLRTERYITFWRRKALETHKHHLPLCIKIAGSRQWSEIISGKQISSTNSERGFICLFLIVSRLWFCLNQSLSS